MALYTDTVMDHFRNPRNVGEIENADGVGEVGNAKCGDIMAAQPHIRPRELRALSMPVLVLAGTHDVILSAHTRRIARSIPGAKLLFLEGPHQLSVASPEDYNRAVLSFLASCEP